jgi:hypothetical protein
VLFITLVGITGQLSHMIYGNPTNDTVSGITMRLHCAVGVGAGEQKSQHPTQAALLYETKAVI